MGSIDNTANHGFLALEQRANRADFAGAEPGMRGPALLSGLNELSFMLGRVCPSFLWAFRFPHAQFPGRGVGEAILAADCTAGWR